MRIAELSARSGRSIPTIKYYLREGLLDPGRRSTGNNDDYDEGHLHRLRLITTLVEVGGLSIAGVRSVLAVLEDEGVPMHDVLGVAHSALDLRGASVRASGPLDGALRDVDGFLRDLGWELKSDAPAKLALAAALASLRDLGWRVGADVFDRYAALAGDLAAWELGMLPERTTRSRTVEAVVVGTIIFEVALVALRRLAHERHSALVFGAAGSDSRWPQAKEKGRGSQSIFD